MTTHKKIQATLSEIKLLFPDNAKCVRSTSKKTASRSETIPSVEQTISKSTIPIDNPLTKKVLHAPCFTVNQINLEFQNPKTENCKPNDSQRPSTKNSHYDIIKSVQPSAKYSSSKSSTKKVPDPPVRVSLLEKSSGKCTAGSTTTKNQYIKRCRDRSVHETKKTHIGNCPPTMEEIARMSKQRQKFFLTQDPRKKYCLRNPDSLHPKPFKIAQEIKAVTDVVKYADNVCKDTDIPTEPFICEIIDKENPLQLDFQGMDYKTTYEQDEQDVYNIRAYTQVGRYMDRKRVKAETADLVERELQAERVAIPKCFDVPDCHEYATPEPSEESFKHGKLFRTIQKPKNKETFAKEHEARQQRYKSLYLAKKQKEIEQNKQKKLEEVEEKKKLGTTLAEEYFKNVLLKIDEDLMAGSRKNLKLKREVSKQHTYPHTLKETKIFRKQMKEEDRKKRDEKIIRKEFFLERTGKVKEYPEVDLEISEDSVHSVIEKETTEESTNDEDDLEVGKRNSKFKLRGFHYKLGKNLRGKTHQDSKAHKVKTCITREEWLQELAPKKEHVKIDVEVGIQKVKGPDDPDLMLFTPTFGYKPPPVKSAIKNFIEKPLGEHYKRDIRRNIKLLKPKLKYSVKKFNLINYMFGETSKSEVRLNEQENYNVLPKEITTDEYIKMQHKLAAQQKWQKKLRRLKLLGIPCNPKKKSKLTTKCEQSSSDSDSEWVPPKEPDYEPHADDHTAARHSKIPFHQMGNMPAPKFRETTLRRHPRTPRAYDLERVPSAEFHETVKRSGIPHMYKIEPDAFEYANLKEKKRACNHMLEARHHHDHWLPTKKNYVDVHYLPKIVKPEITKVKSKNESDQQLFAKAEPPCNKYVNMHLCFEKVDTPALIKQKLHARQLENEEEKTELRVDLLQPKIDEKYHTRPREDAPILDFPGHQQYVDFLYEIRDKLQQAKNEDEKSSQLLKFDREELYKELEEELESIASCLTSLSDSVCTNLTNDSGSFLLMEGKTKVPLDYIRKSVVPFEELQRSRFKTELIDLDAEENNPFKTMPVVGQLRYAKNDMHKHRDIFFTYNTRLRNGIRLRLEVPVEDVRNKLIGPGRNKYKCMVATDIDETYVTGLKNRLPVKRCAFKTGGALIKDALRLKFESLLIQGQIVRNKIYDRLNEQHWDNMIRAKVLYEKLFANWEKKEYDTARKVVYKVKDYYDTTDWLKSEAHEMEHSLTLLNMDIVFIEGLWIRRLMYQNFHYLLADKEWRLQHDWIHKSEDNEQELESFEESIAKRSTKNIRQREKDDAWAIKAFYENIYLQNLHPIIFVFPNVESFFKGIENLKLKTFVILLELHYTLWIHTELQDRLESFELWCKQDLQEREDDVSRKCSKLYFMEHRADYLKNHTLTYLNETIEKSYTDEHFNFDRGIICEVFKYIVPGGTTESSPDLLQMVAMIANIIMELIAKFDQLDTVEARRIETQLRKEQAFKKKLSKQAYEMERRIEKEVKRVCKSLEDPYKKPLDAPKWKKTVLKKKQEKKGVAAAQTTTVSDQTKLFYRAFHDDDKFTADGAAESIDIVDKIQENIVPFYFDHFLKLNGYTPNYNFKTQIELRDGLEIERLKVKSIIPEVMQKLHKWEEKRKKDMEDNIARNPKMYENVI